MNTLMKSGGEGVENKDGVCAPHKCGKLLIVIIINALANMKI